MRVGRRGSLPCERIALNHVLIVDDDVDSATSLRELVAAENFTVALAHTLRDARRQIALQPPDLVLLDLQLPDGSGLDLFADPELVASSELVLVTGHASLETSIEALRLGAADYLVKPIALRQLQGVLSRFMKPAALKADVARMNAGLQDIVREVRAGTEQIAAASGQIAGGNADLSGRTEQQASTVQQTAAAMEQLGGTVQANAASAAQADALAVAARRVAGECGAMVGQVVERMGAIQSASQRITDIIGVIDGIAFQTNLLALNAAVEAARAGELGRGFAVVAGEVRALAQRSAQAAQQVKGLIADTVAQVDSGSQLVERAGATMDEVVAGVQRVSTIVGEIAGASARQHQGIAEVGQSIVALDRTTQQNAALVEQASAAAESLRQQAAALARTVGRFRV